MSAALADVNGLDHLDSGPACGLSAERGSLFAVQLDHREAGVLHGLGDFLQLRVHEDPDHLALAPECRADSRQLPRPHSAGGCPTTWIRPIAQAPRRTASAASSRLVTPRS